MITHRHNLQIHDVIRRIRREYHFPDTVRIINIKPLTQPSGLMSALVTVTWLEYTLWHDEPPPTRQLILGANDARLILEYITYFK